MCGLSVYYSSISKDFELSESLIEIQHRGPDAKGIQTWQLQDNLIVGFGHVRLSIVDISTLGNQPMVSSDGRIAMVFNGEIYNQDELRGSISDHCFKSTSDSEVLLECYAHYGTDCFANLRGMFAAAFLEIDTGRLIILRDQIGVKPIYYGRDESGFYFSSEIRGLRKFISRQFEVSREDLFEFLNCGFIYEPNTGITGIKKVPAGCYLEIVANNINYHRYFSLNDETKKSVFDHSLIQRAIQRQLDADVKLGVFFSGGLDSSVIASFARKPNLYAHYDVNEVIQSGHTSDWPYAVAIAKKLQLDLSSFDVVADQSDSNLILESMSIVAKGTEELISDYTYYASRELSRVARSRGFKVMLSGMGGDEAFVGYPRYKLLIAGPFFSAMSTLFRFGFVRDIARYLPSLAKKVDRFGEFLCESNFMLRYSRLLGYFSRIEIGNLWGRDGYDAAAIRFSERGGSLLAGFENDHPLVKALVLDYHGFLSHNLSIADKSSMSCGLEVRVPLLDQELYCGYIGSLRSGKSPLSFGKLPLKRALEAFLPRTLIERRKTGFNPPLDGKIEKLGRSRIMQQLCESNLGVHLNLAAAETIVDEHFSGNKNNSYKIWQLLYLSFWLNDKVRVSA